MMIHSYAMSHMDQYEFIGNLILLIVGGNDTTRNTMSAYAYGLSQFPDERAKLEGNPDLITNATQEIIRWQTPLAHMRRPATQDYEIEGQQIREIGRPSCREGGGQSVSVSVVAVQLKKKKIESDTTTE